MKRLNGILKTLKLIISIRVNGKFIGSSEAKNKNEKEIPIDGVPFGMTKPEYIINFSF